MNTGYNGCSITTWRTLPNKLQAEPNTNMKVGCCKVDEQQVAEECAEVKLGMAGDKSDNGEHFVSFSALNNFALV